MLFSKNFLISKPVLFLALASIVTTGCKQSKNTDIDSIDSNIAFAKAESTLTTPTTTEYRSLSQEWQDYWYAGKAEITSYKLEQSRYGEARDGTAVLIYVTEDFLPDEQVKANRQNESNISVLKLNSTKKFITGIYPYSVMNSTFYPVKEKRHAIKVSQSMQEWCGHIYTQINNREQFEIMSHSYFEGASDKEFDLPKDILENELWTQLRMDPAELPVGNINIIPSLEFVRMNHAKVKAYKAEATLTENTYTLTYPELERTLVITYNPSFPYEIEKFVETTKNRRSGKPMTTTATKIKTIKNAYWGKNSNADQEIRKELGLE